MEINNVSELSQARIPVEQLIDSTNNLNELSTTTFQQCLEQEATKEEAFFASLDVELPIAGNSLPLDRESSSGAPSSDLPLLGDDCEPAIPIQSITPEHEDPVFLMTDLLMQLHPFIATSQPVQPSIVSDLPLIADSKEVIPTVEVDKAITFAMIESMNVLQKREKPENLEEQSLLPDKMLQTLPAESLQDPAVLASQSVQQIKESEEPHFLFEEQTTFEIDMTAQSDSTSEPEPVNHLLPINGKPVLQTLVVEKALPDTETFSNVFEQKLADKVTLLVNRSENVAQIQIDPPELGKIDITIEQVDDKTDIKFFAQVEQTKQLIEGSVDKLRIQLAQSGLELGQVDVSAGSQQQRQYAQQAPQSFAYSEVANDEHGNVAHTVAADNLQLLDLYI